MYPSSGFALVPNPNFLINWSEQVRLLRPA